MRNKIKVLIKSVMKGPLCNMKDIFGKSGEGAHKFRFGNVAIVDTLLTIIIAYVISYFTDVPITLLLIILFTLAIFFHWLFCVKSPVNNFIGL